MSLGFFPVWLENTNISAFTYQVLNLSLQEMNKTESLTLNQFSLLSKAFELSIIFIS